MNVAYFRDLVIIIFGILGIIFLIITGIYGLKLYKKVSTLLDEAKKIMEKASKISNYASNEIVQPLIGLAAVVQGGAEAMKQIGKLFRDRKKNG